ncbi:hypothetical protein TWF694_007601 [Orbilia ellipsospora]|uniref:Glycoside hydrolase family 5 domain-containing protein n=1 Tax=Orbilia ellipsospora TaxID=2528407 RepID=A0AAV9XJX4_9PEZI
MTQIATELQQQLLLKLSAPQPNAIYRSKCKLLRVSGTSIVDRDGNVVILKGAAIAGHLNMENFITGYSGHEHELRAAMTDVLGEEKATFFFNKLIENFFTETDAQFYASLGLNCIRVPFNYRHFIDDSNPYTLKPEGFAQLDRVVNICAKYDIYVILDLHAAPGGQNQDWHSDSGLNKAMFWEYKVFQDQAINLWTAIAKHYAGNPVVAGYNPLNEPADPKHTRLYEFYERVEKAIRSVDADHMLFVDGNTYAMDFSHFPTDNILPNTVYACHDYAMMGFPIPGQPLYSGLPEEKEKLRSQFERKVEYMRKAGIPIWNGEFGPVYADPARDSNAETVNSARYEVLKEQLRIYQETGVSWSIWLYKDIGYQGMTYVHPESPYMKLIRGFVEKKGKLALDFWGFSEKEEVKGVYQPFIDGLKATVPEHIRRSKYPNIWQFDRQVERAVRECLMSEYLVKEFAELFEGKTMEELEELAGSFKLENCVRREGLNDVLRKDAERTGK